MGYGALLPCKFGDNDIIPLVIFDDTLYNSNLYEVSKKYISYDEAAQFIDTYIPYMWSAIKFPYVFLHDPIKRLFINFYQWEIPTDTNVITDLTLNGKTVTNGLYECKYGQDTDFYIGGLPAPGSQLTHIVGRNGVSGSVYRFWYILSPEKYLVNGKIAFPSGDAQLKYIYVWFDAETGDYEARQVTVRVPLSTYPVKQVFSNWENLNGYSPIFLTTDPFSPGGSTNPGGGEGDFDGTSDAVDIPALPTVSATDTGFITLFNPTLSQLKDLAGYMWTGAFDVATFRKLFADPMDCILGLSIVPVAVPNAGLAPVKVGNISTGIEMNIATSQYVAVDCGTINVNEYWGAYLDYDPYTKAEIYLPYIGTHPIATDDIMGKAVHVVYHVDILSGACTAYVKCGDSVLYSYIGQLSSSIPVTGNDWTNVINGVLSIAGSVGSMIATAGATTPLAVSSIASTAINSNKPSIARSGSMSGTGGMLALQTPYLILTRPRQAVPANQNKYTGYPAFITSNLGSVTGYTEIESIHLEGIPATESELNEIESILKAGVIF